jgi:CBS domain-containing protein
MPIKSVCTTKVVTIQKGATLQDVSNLMQKYHVGSIIVTEGFNGKRTPLGIITDRDVALALGPSPRPKEIKVEQIMQSVPITAEENDGIYETIFKMRKNGVKRLPVVHDDGSLMGIVSADDLLGLMGEEITNLSKINEVQIRNEQGVKIPVETRL